jgi:ADP-heptose:LPS heptosyltransferase
MNERIFKKLYNHYTTRRKEPHLIDTYLDAVSTNIKIEDRDHIKQFKSFVDPKGNILILPFAIRKAKEWNLTKYLTLAEQLNEDYNIKIISAENFIDGDVEADIRNNRIPFAVTRTLDELINEIKNSSVFISNDTGPLYIANLLGKPTFTIYGPTNPDYSLPFGNNHMYIREKINCTPDKAQYCFTEAGTYCPVYNCMNLLSVEKVYNKLISFLQSLSINRKSNFKG